MAVQNAALYFDPLSEAAAEKTVGLFIDRTFLKLHKADGLNDTFVGKLEAYHSAMV